MFEFNATFLIAMISFVVFIIIMNAIFYKPILSIIEKRQRFVDDNYNCAKTLKNEAGILLENYEQKLNEASKEARVFVANESEQLKRNAESVVNKAKVEASNKIDAAKKELQEKRNSVDLSVTVQELAQSISKKLLGENSWIQ